MNEDLRQRLEALVAAGDVEGLARMADALHRLGRWPEAEPFLRAGRAAGHLGSLERLATLLDLTGRESEAEPFYREAIAAGSDLALVQFADMLLPDESRWAEAEEYLRRAVERDAPSGRVPSGFAHFVLGKLLARQPGREAEAEAAFLAVTEPSLRPGALHELSKLLRKLPGREAETEAALRASGLPDAEMDLAGFLASIPGRRHEAVALLRRAAEAGVEGAWNNLTVLLREMGDIEGASAAFRDAISAGEDQLIVHYGEMLRLADRPAEAEQVLRGGLESDPRCAMVLGTLLMERGERAEEGRQLLVTAAGSGVARAAVLLARPRPWHSRPRVV